MKRFGKALVCLLLAVCMMTQMLPAAAAAKTETAAQTTEDGSGITMTTKLPSKADKFTDISKGSWYYEPVCYVTDNNIFAGTSDTTFDPFGTMTRAMVVSVLARMAGADTDEFTEPTGFSDVKSGSWYEASVAWAVRYGITSGTGDGMFSPDRPVTRQELATLFVNYFTLFGVSLGDKDLIDSEPTDIDTCFDWAKESVLVLWQRGLMVGDGSGAFDPLRNITRAECAVLCMQIHKIVEEWKAAPNDSPWRPAKPGGEGDYTVTFLDGNGNYITEMTAQNGIGLGGDRVPFFKDPDPDNGVYFWGWFFHDETLPDAPLRLFNALYPYNTDMTVYAICATQQEMHVFLEDEYYVVEGKVGTTYSVLIRPIEAGTEFDPDYDLAIYADDYNVRADYTVTPQENGDLLITVEGLKPGGYYTVVISKDFVFVMPQSNEPDAPLLAMSDDIRYIEFVVEKPVHAQMQFREDVCWLPTSEATFFLNVGEGGLGVERELDDTTTRLGTGSFRYIPKPGEEPFAVGTVVGVYNDDTVSLTDAKGNPIEVKRLAPNVRDYDEAAYEGLGYSYADLYASGTDVFYTITKVDVKDGGSVVCSYREMDTSEIEQILFVPEMIPYAVAELPDRVVGTVGTIKNYATYDMELYAGCYGDKLPQPRVGDFVTLFTDDLRSYGEAAFEQMREGTYTGTAPYVYGQITAVDGMKLTYEVTTQERLIEALEYIDKYYVERYVPDTLQPKVTEEDLRQFEEQTEELLDEEAIRAFVTMAIDEDAKLDPETAAEAKELLENNEISYEAGKPALRTGDLPDDSKKIQVTGKEVSASFKDKNLSYIPNTEGRFKLGINVGAVMIVKLRLRENVNLYYVISANFTQEICIGFGATGSYKIGWKLIVPYLKTLEFSLSAVADSATDVTLDVRHYTVDKTHMGSMYLYGRQADAQEQWQNFQAFLLDDAFVRHGAALYNKEAEYYNLVAEAKAIDASDVMAREKAEMLVRIKAQEINDMWTDKGFGLDYSWVKFYKQGGSQAIGEYKQAAAEAAMTEAKQKVVANLSGVTSKFPWLGSIVDKTMGDVNKKVEEAGEELADLNPDGTETEEWKEAQKAIEAAKAEEKRLAEKTAEQKKKEKESAEKFSKNVDTYMKYAEESLKGIWSCLEASRATLDNIYRQLTMHPGYDVTKAEGLKKALDGLTEATNIVMTVRRFVQCFKELFGTVKSAVNLVNKNFDGGMEMAAEIYKIVKSVHGTLKDCKLVLGELKQDFFEEGSDDYNRCKDGIDAILKITDATEKLMSLLQTAAKFLELDVGAASHSKTDGITDVPANTNYWKFRLLRDADFSEFSLNTEILERLNSSKDEMSDESMKVLAEKYSEMCNMTNTWMDLYRKQFVDQDIPIFAGLDVNIGIDFVVQLNVNVALNFNFHVDYGKEFRLTIDILGWDIDMKALDRTNQMLSVSMITMGTLGLRTGFEIKLGVKVIKIFTASVTMEIMPYISLYAYALFQYKRDFFQNTSDLKYMGAMYIDIGIHLGLNLALKLDVLVFKNTWKWNLWNKNITLADLGERRNVYNFGYPQPAADALSDRASELEAAKNGTAEEKSGVNTDVEGILIVNPATGYQIPAQARIMSYMDMTDGSLGKTAFDADHYKYTFFTVPTQRDTVEYKVEGNLPVCYAKEEVVVTDKDGNIIYEENDGAGLPVEVSLDADLSDYWTNLTLATNNGTPKKEWVETDRATVDMEGVRRGDYVKDDRFTVTDGVIRFLPAEQDGLTYAQDVYVLMEWDAGTLEFTSYPIRRVVHILWSNEDPITFLSAEVTVADEDPMTDCKEEYTVWADTVVKGYDFIYIPPLQQVMDSFDPSEKIYEREHTTYVGKIDNWGTYIDRPQENMHYYITSVRKEYSLDIYGLDKDGNAVKKTVTAPYGYRFPIDDVTLPADVATVDGEGNPQYLHLSGYLALQSKDGTEETWTGVWENATDYDDDPWSHPVDMQMAADLTDENIPRYLRASYDDETVKAMFTFVGIEHEQMTQYLRRGNAPDLTDINAEIRRLQAEAAAEGKTLNVSWSEGGRPQRFDHEYILFCNVTCIAPPKVAQNGDRVRIIADMTGTEATEDDAIIYGYAVQTEDLAIRWLPYGVDTAQVEPGTDYAFFSCLIDGETLERTYSSATEFTPTGEREDVGYQTVLTLESYEANPVYPLVVTYTVLYTTGLMSEPVTVTLEPGDVVDTALPFDGSPEKIMGLMFSVTDENGEPPEYTYEIMVYGTSVNGTETWSSDTAYLFFCEDEDTANARLTFTKD